jgi:regulator of protease activity HflC (stomatin/prohibitin superfamily)
MLTSVPLIDHVWESVGWWLKAILIAAVSCILLAKSVKYVSQGELGLRHLRGKVRPNAKPIKPGWAFHMPFVGGVMKKSILLQTWQLSGVLVPKGGRTWDANYSITFMVNPERLYASWFGHQDPDEYLRTVCASGLWNALKNADGDPDRVDHAEMERRVLAPAGQAVELIGLVLVELRHRWTAETTASQLGSAIRDTRTDTVHMAAVAALNGNGQVLSQTGDAPAA